MNRGSSAERPPRGFRRLSIATAITTYLLIVWGGVVRVTGSGLGCDSPHGGKDNWPLCDGGLLPPFNQAGVIEFIHRWLASIATLLVVILAVWVFAKLRSSRRLTVAAALTLCLFVVQIILGAITVEFKLPPAVILVHLANAEFLLSALIFIAVTAYTQGTGNELAWRNPPARSRLAMSAALFTYVVLLTGSNVVAQSAGAACDGWPFCGNGGLGLTLAQTGAAAVNLFHRFAVGILLILVGAAVSMVRKMHAGDRSLRLTGVAVNLVLLLQIIAGALVVEWRLPSAVKGIHLALASLLWSCTVLMALLARRARPEGRVLSSSAPFEASPASRLT